MRRAPRVPRRRVVALLAAAAATAAAPAVARAQGGAVSPACAAQLLPLRDACQKAFDLVQYSAPALGVLVGGGNSILGGGGPTGGLGHFSLGLRVNVVGFDAPRADQVRLAATGPVASTIGTSRGVAAFPVADAAIGVFSGVPVGLTSVGAVDLLVNAAYVPNYGRGALAVRPADGRLDLGLGARVGLLRETTFVPGVAVSALHRGLPRTSITATSDAGDSFGVNDARVRVTSWRLTASKNLLFVALAAGVGQDRFAADADLAARTTLGTGPGGGPLAVEFAGAPFRQRLTRRTYFADLTLLAVPFARVVGEVGRTEGGTLAPTFNSFDGRRPDRAFTYASLGVRVGR